MHAAVLASLAAFLAVALGLVAAGIASRPRDLWLVADYAAGALAGAAQERGRRGRR